jgi:hypothetical protein
VVIATGVTADGRREVLGLDVGDSEDGAFWTAFLRSLEGPRPGRGAAPDPGAVQSRVRGEMTRSWLALESRETARPPSDA